MHDEVYPLFEGLGETTYTYINFHKVKSVAYRYNGTMPNETHSALVPKILHHIWLQEHGDDDVEQYQESYNACTTIHKSEQGWQHWLWTEDIATEWVRVQYPHLYKNYTSYGQIIQRANILSYLVLYHYGGVHLDMDLECKKSLDEFLHVPFLASSTSKWPVGINNAFILARPRHHFLEHLIYDGRIEEYDREWPIRWMESMMSTGSLFLSNALMEYVKYHKGRDYRDSVFVLADNHGHFANHSLGGKADTDFFHHRQSGPWHSYDARIILSVERNPIFAIVGLVLVVLAWLLATYIGCSGRPHFCKGRKRRESDRKRQDMLREARERHVDSLREKERRRWETLPSHHTTPRPDDAFARLIAILSDGADPTDSTYRSISPLARPSRSTVYPESRVTRTSSLMMPSRTGFGGRSSIYDFAY